MKFRQNVTFSLLFYIALCFPLFAQQVDIPDTNLRTAVREALNLSDGVPITQANMRQLTYLEVRDKKIKDLSGLEYAVNITGVNFFENQITNLSPLAELIHLEYMQLDRNPISDLSPLAKLTQLDSLYVWQCQIIDISPLANLTKLTRLFLSRNRIVDISALANLTQLTELNLSHNRIVVISPLANLTRLTTLALNQNEIVDVSPLENLTNLEYLDLQNNRITDVTPLENLTNLEHLNTLNNPIFAPDSPLVDIPDPNLRIAIREALHLPGDVAITQANMLELTYLEAQGKQIEDLSGLEHAVNITGVNFFENRVSNLSPLADLINLEYVQLDRNPISDLSPLAKLTQLDSLYAWQCEIVDISPLANLIKLTRLFLSRNRIVDINPLANLTQLTELDLSHNRIADISPLSNLTQLTSLGIGRNDIADHSPLDALSLTYLNYDQSCEMRPHPLQPRLENRTFPSVFAIWSPVTLNQPHVSEIEQSSQHDLFICCLFFDQQFFNTGDGWEVRGDHERALILRDQLLLLNPNMIFLAEIRMRDAGSDYFPTNSPYWIRDAQGNIVELGEGDRLIDFTHPDVQEIIVRQAIAVSKCGLYDGIMFDWWRDDGVVLAGNQFGWTEGYVGNEAEQRARDNILQRIRAETRPDFLIMGNTNDRVIRRTGHYLNGGYMESSVPHAKTGDRLEESLTRVENSLLWLEQNLREPRINSLQGGSNPNEPPDSPTNLRWMRAITTLSLTHSDGYVLFAIGTGDSHYWYDFWDADLGRPLSEEKAQLYDNRPGLYIREYTNGWAVYNHSGGTQEITFPELVNGVASRAEGTTHALPNYDGEMYLRVKPKNPADVNGDGVVNILDLTIVAQALGTDSKKGDVNGDGLVNILDLVFVANQF